MGLISPMDRGIRSYWNSHRHAFWRCFWIVVQAYQPFTPSTSRLGLWSCLDDPIRSNRYCWLGPPIQPRNSKNYPHQVTLLVPANSQLVVVFHLLHCSSIRHFIRSHSRDGHLSCTNSLLSLRKDKISVVVVTSLSPLVAVCQLPQLLHLAEQP
jgi:hypothetical protein